MLNKKSFLSFVIAIMLLLTIGFTFTSSIAAPTVVDQYPGNQFIISGRESEEYRPAIAYNSVHNEYLVVWENSWAGGHHDVYAQRVSGDGQLLSWFAVASHSNKQMNPSVAYDPVNDRYLVVFAYDYYGDDSDWDIYGRFIPWSGPDPALLDFPICEFITNQRRPVVVYAFAQEEFLVTWTNGPSGQPTYISARRVYADGTGFPAGAFVVSSGPENRDYQDVTYNLARNEYLVTWDINNSGNLDIAGIRLSATGVALTGGSPSVTGEFMIAGWPDWEERPSVAACSDADQYLVAWQSDVGTGGSDEAIYGRYLNGEAVPGNVYLVADTTLPQAEVDVSCNASRQTYLLAWHDQYAVPLQYGIWARIAYPDENMEPEFVVVPPGSSQNRLHPAIGGGYSTYLVAWEHQRDGGTNSDIHGRLLRYTMFLPLLKK
jgi:hypothetical protein